jgi:DNA-binding transcriptional MerR regulator
VSVGAGKSPGGRPRFRVGDAARFFGISPDLVRHYERTGLVSSSSVGSNGYRQFSFEDLIKLNYVRVLRSLDFGLEEVSEFIEDSGLPRQAGMLGEKEAEVEARIAELRRLSDELRCYRKGIDEIGRCLGRVEFLDSSPAFACSFKDPASDPFMLEARGRLEASSLARGGTYSLLVRGSFFRGGGFDGAVSPLCSGLWLGAPGEALPPGLELFASRPCAHTVFTSRVEVGLADLEDLAASIRSAGAEPEGDALLQYLAFEKGEGGFVDYVEAWISIK